VSGLPGADVSQWRHQADSITSYSQSTLYPCWQRDADRKMSKMLIKMTCKEANWIVNLYSYIIIIIIIIIIEFL